MIKKVLWASMLDYPGEISTVLFTGNCNWNCEYCQNKPLFNMENQNFNDILKKIINRKSMINHIILSGGECTLSKYFDYYIKKLKENDFKIGIHTNGENYDEIKNNILDLDFVGLDIKTSHNKYNNIANTITNTDNIEKTLSLLINSKIKYEIRTTLFPKYVSIKDLEYIAKYIKKLGVEKYFIQKYIPLSEEENNYSDEEILEFEKKLNNIIKTKARGLI